VPPPTADVPRLTLPGETCVFLHSPSEAPDARTVVQQVPEFEHYGERAILLANLPDVVCVAHPIDDRYLSFLWRLGIGPRPENVVVIEGVAPGTGLSARLIDDPPSLDRLAERLRGPESIVLSPFFATPAVVEVGRALSARLGRSVQVLGGPPGLVRQVHEKRFARELAQSLGIPVAPGDVVTLSTSVDRRGGDLSDLRRSIERWGETTGRVIVRGSSGASGSSTFTLEAGDVEEVVEAIARRTDNSVYLIEPYFEATVSPNVEVVVEPESAVSPRVVATDQLLNPELVYQGSAHPSKALRVSDMLEDSLAIAGWMRHRGFTGRVGFDFVEHDRGTNGRPGYFLTEVNPRINGASYPIALIARLVALAHRIDGPAPTAFQTSNVPIRVRAFAGIENLCGSLLYDPARGEGIVPYTVGALPLGKVGVSCFGHSSSRVADLFTEFVSLVGSHDVAATAAAP
jgi:hypothetical protein